MNKILTAVLQISILLLICSAAHAQDNNTYSLKYGLRLAVCNALGEESKTKDSVIIDKGVLFKIEGVLGDKYIIHILSWEENYRSRCLSTLNKENKLLNDKYVRNAADSSKKFFLISKLNIGELGETKYTLPKGSFTFGATTIPIKVRFASKENNGARERYFDFNGEVNIGLTAGYKLRPSRNPNFFINFLAGVGITSIPVDSSTTNGYVSSSTKASGLTPSIGVLFEIKDFQIGVYSGIDFLARELGDRWSYKNQPWLGIGIGFSIFRAGEKPSTIQSSGK